MILDDDGFLDCQEDFARVHKRAKWLSEHIETLNVLLKHMKSNRYSVLRPHYSKYKHMLQQKTGEFIVKHRESLRLQRVVLDSMLYHIDLPDDIKLHMMPFVYPFQSIEHSDAYA